MIRSGGRVFLARPRREPLQDVLRGPSEVHVDLLAGHVVQDQDRCLSRSIEDRLRLQHDLRNSPDMMHRKPSKAVHRGRSRLSMFVILDQGNRHDILPGYNA